MFDFDYQTPDDAFIHFNAAIYLNRVCIQQLTDRRFSANVSKTFDRTLSFHILTYLAKLTFLTILPLFTFVTCQQTRLSTSTRHSFIPSFSMRCVLLYGRAWDWSSSIFVENQHHSPVHGRRTILSRVLQTFVWHRQFITDKILLLQQMLSANFWWVFRLQCLKSCRIVLGWVYIWLKKNVNFWSHSTRIFGKKNIKTRSQTFLSTIM